ncbi:MAG: hypothetical protein ABJA98_16520 [Acidobacteriota bacterium]
MKNSRFLTLGLSPLLLLVGACAASKSANPLSPTIAGPIPGVAITAPTPIEPNSTKVAVDKQPVTLLLENAATSGPRPLSYVFEVATDAGFTNKVFMREGVAPGENGRTTLRLPDPLAAGRTYYWRGHAEDGANVGPYSSGANFEVFVPIVIDRPTPLSPINDVRVDTLHPTFTFANAPHSGPVGPITYVIEVSDTDSFANRLAIWTLGEQPGQTSLVSPQDGIYDRQVFWHVRAFDPTTTGPWSVTQVFRTPLPPPPPPTPTPTPSPTPGGAGNHVGPGPLSEDRARQVVFATGAEFPHLTRVFGSDGEALSAASELLDRTIWHLQLAGYQSGRQRNPSGLVSDDKLTIFINGSWHIYDVFSLGFAGRATTVQFVELTGASYVPTSGRPD